MMELKIIETKKGWKIMRGGHQMALISTSYEDAEEMVQLLERKK